MNVDDVLDGDSRWHVETADCIRFLSGLPDNSIDLIFSSPPYSGKLRRYGLDKPLAGRAWASWMLAVISESVRVCRGLTAYVIDAGTAGGRWDVAPAHLMAMLDDAGFHQFHPSAYVRYGIPGKRPFFKNLWEFVLCVHRPGQLPYSNPLACGQPPKYGPGGDCSNRTADGSRTKKHKYKPPKIANPGNVHFCTVGGGKMGRGAGKLAAHKSEAPFPEALVEPYILSFTRPGDVVCDPFVGSGTALAVAVRHGRRGVGCDCRYDMVALASQRIACERWPLDGERNDNGTSSTATQDRQESTQAP